MLHLHFHPFYVHDLDLGAHKDASRLQEPSWGAQEGWKSLTGRHWSLWRHSKCEMSLEATPGWMRQEGGSHCESRLRVLLGGERIIHAWCDPRVASRHCSPCASTPAKEWIKEMLTPRPAIISIRIGDHGKAEGPPKKWELERQVRVNGASSLTEMGFSTQLGKTVRWAVCAPWSWRYSASWVGLRSIPFGTQHSQLDSSSHRLEGYRLQRKKSSRDGSPVHF